MIELVLSTESNAAVALLRLVAKQVKDVGLYQADNLYEKDINDKYGVRGKKRSVRFRLAPGATVSMKWEEGTVFVKRLVETKVVGCGDLGPRKFDSIFLGSEDLDRRSLKRLLIHSFEKYEERSNKQMVSLKIFNGTFWDARGLLPKRHPETVFLPKSDLEGLEKVLQRFVDSKDVYHRYQIPYKQVILLEGLPGTGKTSLAFMIASKFQRDLYVLPLTNDTDDYTLNNALASVMPASVLVIEDIDSLFNEDLSIKPKVTLSGITNALDGLSRVDNLWIILTSNHSDRLPPVLLRKGRIDYRMSFDTIKSEEVERMVQMFFEERKEDPDIPRLVKAISEKAERHKLVSAACVSFLFSHRDDSACEILKFLNELNPSIQGSNTLYS